MMNMFNDVDDFLHSNPKDKFFDVVFNANNDIAILEIEKMMQKFVVMESLLEKMLSENLDNEIRNELVLNPDEMLSRLNNLYILKMGDILSQSE